MFVLEIRFLTGRYAAATVTDPGEAEWPPHPARVYSALTAALHDEPEPPEDEVLAMKWLERAGPPEIHASDAGIRQLGNVFVPTNDQKALRDIDAYIDRLTAAEQALSDFDGEERTTADRDVDRVRAALIQRSLASARADGRGAPSTAAELVNRRLRPQPRRFPVAIPHDDCVHLAWGSTPDSEVAGAIDRIAGRVARLGHPSSLVSMRALPNGLEELTSGSDARRRWVPDNESNVFFRVAGPGQLGRLREAHQRHRQVEQRILPAEQVRYRVKHSEASSAEIVETVFSSLEADWIVFEIVGEGEERRQLLDASLTQHVARAMRGTLLQHLDPAEAPATLTGHDGSGQPAVVPHIAYVPLADVRHPHESGHGYATGSILGLAVVPPRDIDSGDRALFLKAVHLAEKQATEANGTESLDPLQPAALRLTLGRHGVLHLRRLRERPIARTLQVQRWTGPSRRWTSATAIALGRNPGDLRSRDSKVVAKAVEVAQQIIAADCVNLGLPEPERVWIHRRSLLDGSPAAHRFMPFPAQGNGPRRVCVHAELLFTEPVRGPLILGAGRYFGLGLCAPVREAR